MVEYPRKEWRKVGKKCFGVLKHGTSKTKTICRVVYAQKTLTPRYPLYWFRLTPKKWVNTTKEGLKDGIVAYKRDFWRLKRTLKK